MSCCSRRHLWSHTPVWCLLFFALVLTGSLVLPTASHAATPITITTQDQWNANVGPASIGDFVINAPSGGIMTHTGNPLRHLSITGAGVGSAFSVYGPGPLNVNGWLTLNSINEAVQIGSEGLASPQNGTLNVQSGGVLNILSEIHLGGEANSASQAGGDGILLVDGGGQCGHPACG